MSESVPIQQLRDKGEDLRKEVEGASDRAAILVWAAIIDHELKRAIGNHLGDIGWPVHSFGARIKVAYHLGFIDEPLQKSLDGIRKIRNSMAHAVTCRLDDPEIKKHIDDILKRLLKDPHYVLRDEFLEAKDDPRESLNRIMSLFSVLLSFVADEVVRYKSPVQASVTGVARSKGKEPPDTGFAD